MTKLVLASGSAIRARILLAAGIPFDVRPANVDEAIIKQEGLAQGKALPQIALDLATAKAQAEIHDDALVLGSDQILEFEGKAYDKPKDMSEARDRLLAMSGKTHTLINASVISKGSNLIWHHVEQPILKIRNFTEQQIDAYLHEAGPEILSSVGAYQVENIGSRLFESIEGDYFAVLGLSLLPILPVLREHEIIAF